MRRVRFLALFLALVALVAACGGNGGETTEPAAEEHESNGPPPAEVVAEIESLLDEVVTTYEAGDAEAAGELAAQAYLENYEVIEHDVIEKAPDLNEELEPLLGADLRDRMAEGAPVSEIKSMVDRAKELLDEALTVLEES